MKTFEQAAQEGCAATLDWYANRLTKTYQQQLWKIRAHSLYEKQVHIDEQKRYFIEKEGVIPFEERPQSTQEVLDKLNKEEREHWEFITMLAIEWPE